MSPEALPAAERVVQINALRDLVAFLDARPEVPIPAEVTAYIAVPGGVQGDREMMLAARRMGAALRVAPDGTTSAVKVFGPLRLRVVRPADPDPVAYERRHTRLQSPDLRGGAR